MFGTAMKFQNKVVFYVKWNSLTSLCEFDFKKKKLVVLKMVSFSSLKIWKINSSIIDHFDLNSNSILLSSKT